MRQALIAAMAVLLAAPAGARCETYYVSPGGNDSHAGTSPASAWKTVGKVDGRSFAAGDHVLFECGGAYTGRLRINSSGTQQAPILVASYGTCTADNRPVIQGGAGGEGAAGIDLAGVEWVKVEGFVVRGWTGPEQFGFALYNASHIVLQSVFADGDTIGLRNSSSSTAVDVHVRESAFRGNGTSGLGIQNTSKTSTGWEVVDTEVTNYGDNCVLDWSGHDVFNRVTIHHCGYMKNPPTGKHGFYMHAPGITVENSTIYDIARTDGGACLSPRDSARIINNDLYDSNYGVAFFDNTREPTETLVIARNRMWAQSVANMYIDDTFQNPDSQQRDHEMIFQIAQNTMLSANGKPGVDIHGASGGSRASVTFDNNVLTGAHGQNATLRVFASDTTGSYEGHGNDYWNNGGEQRFSYKQDISDSPSVISGEVSPQTVSPELISNDAQHPDLELKQSSPLLDTGTSDPAGVKLTQDCEGGNVNYCGNAPEPGAYEILQPAGPPPPMVETKKANDVTATTATLIGTGSAPKDAEAYFELGPTSDYGVTTTTVTVKHGADVKVKIKVSGLKPGTLYHFRLVGVGAGGTIRASEKTFKTATSASDTTSAATTSADSAVNASWAPPFGTIEANGAPGTVGGFEHGRSKREGETTPAATMDRRPWATISVDVTDHHPAVTYHARLVATPREGQARDVVRELATAAVPTRATPAARPAVRAGEPGASGLRAPHGAFAGRPHERRVPGEDAGGVARRQRAHLEKASGREGETLEHTHTLDS